MAHNTILIERLRITDLHQSVYAGRNKIRPLGRCYQRPNPSHNPISDEYLLACTGYNQQKPPQNLRSHKTRLLLLLYRKAAVGDNLSVYLPILHTVYRYCLLTQSISGIHRLTPR